MSDVKLAAKLDPAAIDAIFAPVNQSQLPGVAVAVAIDGVPVYRKGFGLANMELPVTLSPMMRMRIGSTSKHFACLAYLLLCEDGRAGLDDAVGKYFPEFHEVARRVTIRQLMGHSSGLRDVVSLCMLIHGTGVPTTEREMLAYYETIDDIDFAPETNWSYNNGAYAMLSTAIERISGQSLDDFLAERVFRPIGMNDTMMRRWDTGFVPNSATLHMVDAAGGYTKQYMGMEISGMGGMVSSMDDMLRWLRHMDAPVVGSAETWRLMKTPRTLSNGRSTGYGLGLISALYRGVPTIAHSGGVMGGNSQMIKVPGAGLDISIATNRADLNSIDLANRIIDACVEGLAPVAEAEETPGEMRTGLFRSSRTGRVVELLAVEDKPFVSVDAAMPFPLKADGDGGFELAPPVDFIKWGVTPSGCGLTFSDFGNADALDEVARDAEAKIGDLAGLYRSAPFAATAEVSDTAEGARLRLSGRHGSHSYKLEPLTATIWKASSLGVFSVIGFTVTFDAEGAGLVINANRAVGLRFARD
ncbi:serine hydrolase domain-containing protein [Sphingomonas colocasiae]|uniref:Beta-lactamase family protein n=1 Tax=Sphingomonas colocasiae TaxID=1848973 RepID=A0ABS7PUY3_9SPHN|nr:serine hydrolase domain-containing protein [Sphingomonas colocasiae]MBY8824956.1 beta-lactamase family protein [Sphingomonas colocasiae]